MFWMFSVTISPTLVGGRNRAGGTATTSMKKMFQMGSPGVGVAALPHQ
jgi:hypothetical protein